MLNTSQLVGIIADKRLSATQTAAYVALDAAGSALPDGVVRSTQKEIAAQAGISVDTVKASLAALIEKGLVSFDGRGYRVFPINGDFPTTTENPISRKNPIKTENPISDGSGKPDFSENSDDATGGDGVPTIMAQTPEIPVVMREIDLHEGDTSRTYSTHAHARPKSILREYTLEDLPGENVDQVDLTQGNPQGIPEGDAGDVPLPMGGYGPYPYGPLPDETAWHFAEGELEIVRLTRQTDVPAPQGFTWDQLLLPSEVWGKDLGTIGRLCAAIVSLGPDHVRARHVLTHHARAEQAYLEADDLPLPANDPDLPRFAPPYSGPGDVLLRERDVLHPEWGVIDAAHLEAFKREDARFRGQGAALEQQWQNYKARGGRLSLDAYIDDFLMDKEPPPADTLGWRMYQTRLEYRRGLLTQH